MLHSVSTEAHEVIAGADVWNKRFGQLYTFIRNRLLRICNIDVNEMLEDASLEAWHSSIEHTHPHALEILGYVRLLRSTAQLEQGIDEPLQLAMSTICKEHEQAVAHPAEDNNGEAQQSEREKVHEGPQGGSCGDQAPIDHGRMEVEVENESRMEWTNEMGTNLFPEAIAHDTGMVHGLDWEQLVKNSNQGSSNGDDRTSTTTDAVVKRKRVSSTASILSEVSIPVGGIFELAEYTTAGRCLEEEQTV